MERYKNQVKNGGRHAPKPPCYMLSASKSLRKTNSYRSISDMVVVVVVIVLLLYSYPKVVFLRFFVSICACFSVLLVLPWCCCCRRMLCQLFLRCGSACWSVTLNTRFRFLEDGPRPTRVRSFIGRAGSAAALSQPYRHTGKHPKLERRRR